MSTETDQLRAIDEAIVNLRSALMVVRDATRDDQPIPFTNAKHVDNLLTHTLQELVDQFPPFRER